MSRKYRLGGALGILGLLGLLKAPQNERPALCLLALLNLTKAEARQHRPPSRGAVSFPGQPTQAQCRSDSRRGLRQHLGLLQVVATPPAGTSRRFPETARPAVARAQALKWQYITNLWMGCVGVVPRWSPAQARD